MSSEHDVPDDDRPVPLFQTAPVLANADPLRPSAGSFLAKTRVGRIAVGIVAILLVALVVTQFAGR
jgi:hypothetical protein